ncbi:MAG: hypothetical protein WBC51_12060 [Vicinamibacterales bacterium]
MTHSLFSALLIGVLFSALPGQGSKPNFTGKWTLDVAKSDFGQFPPPESIVHVIEHKEPSIKITTHSKSQMGEMSAEHNLTTDGKEHLNKMRVMNTDQEVKVAGKWDGDKLATSWGFEGQGGRVEFSDSWSLSEDGKVLTLVRVAKSSQGEFTLRTVYNRQ